jgi:membrane protease YdiL (CAAX protease family)
METDRIKVKTVFACLLAILSLELVARSFSWPSRVSPIFILGIIRLLQVISIVGIVQIWEKGTTSVGLNPMGILSGIKKGIIWSTVFGGATFTVFTLFFLIGLDPIRHIKINPPGKFTEIFLFFLVGGILGPIAEEVFFRGILYSFFRRWGIGMAVASSTLIFSGLHLAFSGVSFSQLFGGVLFAIAYEVEKNLMVPIVIHMLGNLTILAISWGRIVL